MNFFRLSKSDHTTWEAFVADTPGGSIHQTPLWQQFQTQIPGRETVLAFGLKDEKNQLQAVTLAVRMYTGFRDWHWFYSPRGPVFKTQDPHIRQDFLNQVAQAIQEQNGLFWRLDPPWTDQDWQTASSEIKNCRPAHKNFQPTDHWILDLKPDLETIRAGMKRTGRRNLKLAEKAGLTIKTITAKDLKPEHLSVWDQLNQATTSRDGFAGHEVSYYQKFLHQLAPHATLYLVYHEATPVAAAILTTHNQQAIYYFGASSSEPDHRQLRAPYLLQWQMIQDAKASGCETYDFTGITPVDQPGHPYAGITQFKTRFPGTRQTFAPGREIILDSGKYMIYKWGKKLLGK